MKIVKIKMMKVYAFGFCQYECFEADGNIFTHLTLKVCRLKWSCMTKNLLMVVMIFKHAYVIERF